MAKSIQEANKILIKFLDEKNITLSEEEKKNLIDSGFLTLNNLNYTVPNMRSSTQFGIKVNLNWFRDNLNNISKPEIRRQGKTKGIDYNFLPVGNKIFIIHYLELREYALQLENEKEKWFNNSTWGMVVDSISESFYWVGNNIRFPLTTVHTPEDIPGLRKTIKYLYQEYLVDAPQSSKKKISERNISFKPLKVDFSEVQKINNQLGLEGEKFILKWEKDRLREIGHSEFAEKIEWVSNVLGDGAGYDILSFEDNGEPRYIEVKTTSQEIDTPFLITQNEIDFSNKYFENYYLYRVFNFKTSPRLFILKGKIENSFELRPKLFEARIIYISI